MEQGNKKIEIPKNSVFRIDAASDFVVFGISNNKRHSIIATGNRLNYTNQDYDTLEIDTKGLWSYTITKLPPRWENPDQTPTEITIKASKPSLREEMRNYVREQLSQMAENEGNGTFEEEDDFDILDSGQDDPISPYEVHEMVDEFLEPQPEPIKPPAEHPLTPPTAPPVQTSNEIDTHTAPPETNPSEGHPPP